MKRYTRHEKNSEFFAQRSAEQKLRKLRSVEEIQNSIERMRQRIKQTAEQLVNCINENSFIALDIPIISELESLAKRYYELLDECQEASKREAEAVEAESLKTKCQDCQHESHKHNTAFDSDETSNCLILNCNCQKYISISMLSDVQRKLKSQVLLKDLTAENVIVLNKIYYETGNGNIVISHQDEAIQEIIEEKIPFSTRLIFDKQLQKARIFISGENTFCKDENTMTDLQKDYLSEVELDENTIFTEFAD